MSALTDPGTYPFTRGLYADGYRRKLWTMRQFAGFGTPAATNLRYKQLLASGGTGLSVAFDLPTLMGRDPDHQLAQGEVGRCGVSVASVTDMEVLFADIDIASVSTSMTINGPAPIVLALYLAMAERRGVSWQTLSGTIQNDILKEFIAQKEYIFPPRPSMRFVTDVVGFCTAEVPRWHPISISGYHIREAGATAAQELAFTLADGTAYVQWAVEAGVPVDAFAPRLSFFFNAHSNLFEEVAKFRAARRMWARIMRERFGARDDRSCLLKFHAQTSGASLTAQQPFNNVVRTAFQALAAVLGGANSIHTNALDEALALPTETAATLALRTQQILAFETGLADVVDGFGGSQELERLTDAMEADAARYLTVIDRYGGMVQAVEAGYPQREVAESAYAWQQAIERGARRVVGVNAFGDAELPPVPILRIGEQEADAQRAAVVAVRRRRNSVQVQAALDRLGEAAAGDANTMPALLDCARAEATVGEMCDVLRRVWGEYEERPSV